MLLMVSPAVAQTATDLVQEDYFTALDNWANSGGDPKKIQEEVITNCGKLVMVMASADERNGFITNDRAEFDFRVDVCAKTTVNRVHPQPEFEKPDIVQMICDDEKELFRLICSRSGLR